MTIDATIRLLELAVTSLVAILASSGFWVYLDKKRGSRELSRRLLIGLAHDRIIYLCMTYIHRGNITQDEYENLAVYLYKPYIDMGGNGTAVRLMAEVDKLPIIKTVSFIPSPEIEKVKEK